MQIRKSKKKKKKKKTEIMDPKDIYGLHQEDTINAGNK